MMKEHKRKSTGTAGVGKFAKAFLVLFLGVQIFAGAKALAFSEDFAGDFEEEEPVRQVTSVQDQGGRRAYAGGRDEQSLEVQASLPIPSRSADGAFVTTTPAGDDNDSSHD